MSNKTLDIDPEILQDLVTFVVNRPQALAYAIMPNEMYALIGRGGGKTVGIIAPWIIHKVQVMPRSNGGLIGKTFTDIETKILQPLFLAFQLLGYEKDRDFVYGKKPPENWPKPLTPIIDYQHVLTFSNGTTMELISLHLKGSANGKSLQWIVCDEAKYVDEVQLRGEVFPILRGHVRHFGMSAWYGAKLFVTDKLSPNMQWLLKKRELVDHKVVATVLYYQFRVNSLRRQLTEAGDAAAAKLRLDIKKLEKVLTALRKKLVYVIEASAMDNIANLSPDFFDNMKRSLTEYEYRVAILNEDPTRVENNFYPDRTERHLYVNDYDQDPDKALGIVFDYQASISPMVCFQVNNLVTGSPSLNFVDAMHVKHPLGLIDVIKDFGKKYSGRPKKHVMYFYDHTAVGLRNGRVSYAEEVQQEFEKMGWRIDMIYTGQAPLHEDKFRRMKAFFNETDPDALPVRMNHVTCATLIMAMDLTETKETDKGTKKNKADEAKIEKDQALTTHYPDCFDQAVWAVNELHLYPLETDVLPGRNGFR